MQGNDAEVIAAGHLCVDIVPTIEERRGGLEALLVPGKLNEVGPAVIATGGSVSNTGLALHKLGVPTGLMGKIGDDAFGRIILDVVSRYNPRLVDDMIIIKGEKTSYTIVISPPGVDRMFLHCPGTNDTFGVDDVAYEKLSGARLFHFGYPPLMRRMYSDGGKALEMIFRRVKEKGLTTSLDMARPDPESDAGRVAWGGLLERVLPHVDIFLPSVEEILFMLDRKQYDRIEKEVGPADIISRFDGALLSDLGSRLLEMGVAIAGLKLGDQGLYVRTTADDARLAEVGRCAPRVLNVWTARELLSPCFKVEVVGTAGSGDCTIAGFLAGFLKGLSPEEAMTTAVAVGACNVERADTLSGIPTWSVVQQRIRSGWERRPVDLSLTGWQWNERAGVWVGPMMT